MPADTPVELQEGNSELDELLPALQAIAPDDVKEPKVKVSGFVEEAEVLYRSAQRDAEQLKSVNLDWTHVENLRKGSAALRAAQAMWRSRRVTRQQAMKEWAAARSEAKLLRRDLMEALKYALRHDPGEVDHVIRTGEAGTQLALIQALNNLASVGRDHQAQLEAIAYEPGSVELAADMSDRLAELLAAKEGEAKYSPSKNVRDRAYTFLKQAVFEVRECGKYVYRNDKEHRRAYTSERERRKDNR